MISGVYKYGYLWCTDKCWGSKYVRIQPGIHCWFWFYHWMNIKKVIAVFLFWPDYGMILEGKMSYLKIGKRQHLNIKNFGKKNYELFLNVFWNISRGCAYFFFIWYPFINRANDVNKYFHNYQVHLSKPKNPHFETLFLDIVWPYLSQHKKKILFSRYSDTLSNF